MPIDFTIFAPNDPDAAERAALYVAQDPLPSVPCSLLSSAEIHDYVRITGMLHPFYPKALKSASYEAHIEGTVIWWDEHERRHERQIKRGEPCVLLPNSITFVQVEPQFRLPNYIAIRFNLRITHVHRGLLLGTGPLVDPGFEGKLLIPLHNLTSSEYTLDTKDALIWVEFTKTTFGFIPEEEIASKIRNFVSFPKDKKNKGPDYYLYKANAGNAIRSSIPDALEQGRRDAANSAASATNSAASATNAENTAASIQRRMTGFGIVGLIALVVALFAIWYQVDGMVQNSISLSTSVGQGLAPLAADGKTMSDKVTAIQTEIDRLKQQLDQLNAQLYKLKQPCLVTRPTTQPSQNACP